VTGKNFCAAPENICAIAKNFCGIAENLCAAVEKPLAVLPVSKWEEWFLGIWDKEHEKFFKNWGKWDDSFN
jgi:hypothetical protein